MQLWNIICDQICQKGSYTCTVSRHFSSPSVSYINTPIAQVFNAAEGWTVYFHSGLFLNPVRCPWVLGWPSNGPVFPWQADSWLWIITGLAEDFVHGFNCFVWHVEVNMAPVEAIGLFLVKMYPLPDTLWCPAHPHLPPYRSASCIGYAGKKAI